jgi:hypothetical protein
MKVETVGAWDDEMVVRSVNFDVDGVEYRAEPASFV